MDPVVFFVTPAYERFALADVCFDQRRRMLDALPFEARAVVVADDQNLDTAKRYGLDVVEMDNSFVGRKFNAGYQYAVENGATHVMPIGSDSWLHPSIFDKVSWGRDAIGLIGLSSFGPYGDERVDLGIKYPAGFGVGMVYPAFALPHEPCAPNAPYGCDTSTWNRVGRGKLRVEFEELQMHRYLNFHSDDVQITDYRSLVKGFNRVLHHERGDDALTPLYDLYDADLIERLKTIYAVRSVGAFLVGRRNDPASTRRQKLPTEKREVVRDARTIDRIKTRAEMREAKREKTAARVIVHRAEFLKFKRGEAALDVEGKPFDGNGGNYRIAHAAKTGAGTPAL